MDFGAHAPPEDALSPQMTPGAPPPAISVGIQWRSTMIMVSTTPTGNAAVLHQVTDGLPEDQNRISKGTPQSLRTAPYSKQFIMETQRNFVVD